ncbi:MFS transporter [Mobilicoccus caccae]|uniref:MFS transporter n=1 Tax=Mobilicoccus caccae TaxID=1859295 RepID=UPI0024E0A4F7|nr:MFS transporter [Mobilicoccus caccae]
MSDRTGDVPRDQERSLWPLYAGGFLGPFGGAILNTMLPELAGGLDTTVTAAGSAVSAYLFPFAALMPLAGLLAARWGAERTVRRAYVVYAAAALVCVVAPVFGVFFAGRVLQGMANAFTTPLLITMIADRVPASRIGRSLGTYASMQAAGMAFAPFVGGLAAAVDYRLAFVVVAVAAGALAIVTPRAPAHTRTDAARPPWRPLLNRGLGQACLVGFTVQFASTVIMLVAALEASDRFGLSPAARGLVVATFGVAGLASGRLVGALADRLGMRRMGFGATATLALAVGAAAWPPVVAALVACVVAAGIAGTGARVMTNTLALRSTRQPQHRHRPRAVRPVPRIRFRAGLVADLPAVGGRGLRHRRGRRRHRRPRRPRPHVTGAVRGALGGAR